MMSGNKVAIASVQFSCHMSMMWRIEGKMKAAMHSFIFKYLTSYFMSNENDDFLLCDVTYFVEQ